MSDSIGDRCAWWVDGPDGTRRLCLQTADADIHDPRAEGSHGYAPTIAGAAGSGPVPPLPALGAGGGSATLTSASVQATTAAQAVREAQDALRTSTSATPPRRRSAIVPREALVWVAPDCVVNPAAVVGMLEDVHTHRDGATVVETKRTSIYLASRQHPIVVENATLDDVLARLDVGDWKPQDFALSEQDRAIADSLIGDKP